MRRVTLVSAATVMTLAAASLQAQVQAPAPAQADTEVRLLKLEMQRMRNEIEIMKGHIGRLVQYLQQRDGQSIAPQPQPQVQQPGAGGSSASVKVNIANAPSLGRTDAPVTIIEFSDFECPFCRRFSKSTLPEIKRDYVDTGKVRYVFMDFPLEQMHAKARKAGEAAHCSAEQGKFWEMHNILFEHPGNLDTRRYTEFAKKLKLDVAAFDRCLESGRQSAKIDGGLASGRSVGISATPSFIITKTDGGDIVGGGVIIKGAQPYERYRQAIEQALAAP